MREATSPTIQRSAKAPRAFSLWDLKARIYRAARGLPVIRRILEREVEALRRLARAAGCPPERVVDIGTGAGDTLGIFPPGAVLAAMDRSRAMARQCRNRHGVRVVAGEAGALPFQARSAGWISAVGLSEYIRNKEELLREIGRVLEPGGYFLVTISPPGGLNRLRVLLGHRLHLIGPDAWESMLEGQGIDMIAKEATAVQIQYLARNR